MEECRLSVTIRDIAKRLDISHTTVSRALNKREDAFISEGTREMVLAVAKELGYRPNSLARALVTGRTYSVALCTGVPSYSPFFAKVAHFMEEEASSRGFDMIIRSLAGRAIASLPQWPLDGLIVFEHPSFIAKHVPPDVSISTAIVSVGVSYEESVDFVHVDVYSAARKAIEYLIASGCRRIAELTLPQDESFNPTKEPRMQAYESVMEAAGLETEYIADPNILRSSARKLIREYVIENGCPDGIFCHNDDMAIGAYRGLYDLGIRVPDDVKLIGCDGIEDVDYLERPFSSIVQPIEQECQIAWQFLERRINNPGIPLQQASLKAHFVARDQGSEPTCAPADDQ